MGRRPERGGPMATKEETQAKPQSDGAQDGASGGDTLSITDNRTGKSYEVEVNDGTIKTMDLRQIKVSDDDFGLMGYDPGAVVELLDDDAGSRTRMTGESGGWRRPRRDAISPTGSSPRGWQGSRNSPA